MPRKFEFRRRHFFAGILCVLQEKVTKYEHKFSGRCRRRINQRLRRKKLFDALLEDEAAVGLGLAGGHGRVSQIKNLDAHL